MRFLQPLYRFTRTTGNAGRRRTIVFLLLCILALLLYLLLGEKPWETNFFEHWGTHAAHDLDLEDFVITGSWFAALLNLILFVALLATAGIWLGGTHPIPVVTETNREQHAWVFSRNGLIFWIGLAVIITGAAWLRAPRLSHSLWNDEEHPIRRYTWGELEPDKKTGELEFDPVSWQATFFKNTGSNNHLGFGISGHMALSIWDKLGGGDLGGRHFSEIAVRMPAYLAGLLSIGGVALFLGLSGFPRCGLGAAALLALHPWHLRYSVEARGYGLMLFFMMLALICLLPAIQRARWRWWCGYGIAQCAYMLCFPGAIYVAITVNAVALFYMGFVQRKKVFWGTQMPRFTVVNLGSAMVFLQLMGPSIPQIKLYLDTHEVARGEMGGAWFVDFLSHLTAGTRWGPEQEFPAQLQYGLQHLSEQSPWLLWVLFGLQGVLLAAGLVFLFRRHVLAGFLVSALLLAGPLAYLHTSTTGNLLFTWYLLYLILPLVMLMPLGLCAPTQLLPETWNPNRICVVLVGLFLIVFAGATKIPSNRIRHIDRQPLRQAVEFVREDLPRLGDPEPALVTGIFGISAEQIRSYDPWVTVLDDAEDYETLITAARQEGRPVKIYVGGPVLADDQDPELYEMLTSDPRFEKTAMLWGLESMFSVAVYEMQTAPVSTSTPAPDPE